MNLTFSQQTSVIVGGVSSVQQIFIDWGIYINYMN